MPRWPTRSAYPARLIDEYAWATDLGDTFVTLTGKQTARKVWREPVGVVGAITPWNFPFEVSIHKLAQALATGNTVVLKPAPDTPFNATRLGRLIVESTDIPAGVVNVVTASDHLVGEELTLSPKVDLISFTGSTAVGKRIMEKGAATMKRLFLELGGKSATIVLEDADLSQACAHRHRALRARRAGLRHPDADAAPAVALRRGRGDSPGDLPEHRPRRSPEPGHAVRPGDLGASSARASSATSRRASTRARSSSSAAPMHPPGSTRGSGSSRPCSSTSTTAMTIAQEEIFGPVLAVIPYDDEDHAVRIANDSPYGLAGNVMSGSLERALAVARRLRAGFIGVNGAAAYGADAPFGGYKASGVGRQNGTAGFDQYTEIKTVAYPVA